MKKSSIIFTGLLVIDVLIFFGHTAYAETHIYNDSISALTDWTASNSPYILEQDITVPKDAWLRVGPGVTIEGDPTLDTEPSIYVNGYVSLNGEAGHPIQAKNISGISLDHATTTVNYAELSLPDGISLVSSYASISSSTVSDAYQGIYVSSGKLEATGITIAHNSYGIFVQPPIQVFPEVAGNSAVVTSAAPPASVSISGSEIIENTNAAIENHDTSTVNAEHNWWGSADGPAQATSGAIIGSVDYTPWLDRDPRATSTACCSSILFIPGIEGTSLYRPEPISRTNTVMHTVWLPGKNGDVSRLFLDQNGSSTDASIYSGDPIASAYGSYDIYGRFIDYLNGLVSKGTVNEWKPFGYDWRSPVDQIVTGMEKKATTTESLTQDISQLAARSKTGKVTIIAHSNGGLVAKYLVKVLADAGNTGLIDSVISVAAPYLGTPQAILSLLHGDAQSIAYGLILKSSVARQLAQNMPSAYSLLPSNKYFSLGVGPTIAFASAAVPGANNGAYPQSISSNKDQSAFIADSRNDRKAPGTSDTSLPIRGNTKLLIAAETLHSILDQFSWPAGITRFAIAGWNVLTSKGVEYYQKNSCHVSLTGFSCAPVSDYRPITTLNGDGTVVAQSALYDSGSPVLIDLKTVSKDEHKEITHADILDSSTTEAVIDSIVTAPSDEDVPTIQRLEAIPGATIGPPPIAASSYLVVSTHSPVELDVYDQEGNHTGPIPAPPEVTDDVISAYEEKIPGSHFESHANSDTDSDTYIYLPTDSNQMYFVAINGVGVGSFTYDVQKVVNDSIVDSVEYSNIPVTPLTSASTTLTVSSGTNDTATLASSTSPLIVDMNGDGSADLNVKANTQVDPNAYLELIKKSVVGLLGPGKRCDEFKVRIGRLEDLIKKGKLKQLHDSSSKLEIRFKHKRLRDTSSSDKDKIVDEIDSFISQFE